MRRANPEFFNRSKRLRIVQGGLITLITIFIYHENLPDHRKIIFSTLLLYPNIWDNWLPPAWSLTMEMYFYLWIAIIALLPQRIQVRAIVWVALLFAAWGAAWLMIDPAGVFDGRQPLRYGLTGLGIEFLAGALLAHTYDHNIPLFQRPRLLVPLCLALIAGGIALGMQSPYFDRVEVMRVASFGVMGAAALTLGLTLEKTRFRPPLWLVLVGNASYSLYLLHTVLLDASGRLLMQWGIASAQALWASMLALPTVIVLISLLWFRWTEKPLMKRIA